MALEEFLRQKSALTFTIGPKEANALAQASKKPSPPSTPPSAVRR